MMTRFRKITWQNSDPRDLSLRAQHGGTLAKGFGVSQNLMVRSGDCSMETLVWARVAAGSEK